MVPGWAAKIMDHDGRQWLVRNGKLGHSGSWRRHQEQWVTSAGGLMATPLPCPGAFRWKQTCRFLRGKHSCQGNAAKGRNVSVHLTGRARYSSSWRTGGDGCPYAKIAGASVCTALKHETVSRPCTAVDSTFSLRGGTGSPWEERDVS